MENRQNRRSRRLETPSTERKTNDTQFETPNQGNIPLTSFNATTQDHRTKE